MIVSDEMSIKSHHKLTGANYQDRWYRLLTRTTALLSKPQRGERYSRGNNPLTCCIVGSLSQSRGCGWWQSITGMAHGSHCSP